MKKTGRLLAVSAATICALGTMTSCNKTGFKVGLLCLHGQTSTYDNNFIDGFTRACQKLQLKPSQYEIRTDVAEDYNQIYSAAKEWAEDGYSMVFADSFGHQEGMLNVAKKYPKTEFCHATGTFAVVNKDVKNFHNSFASIYQGRYLAGVVAGYKLAEKHKIDDNITIGYVGAYPYAEVISGYTSYYLGVKKGIAMALNNDDVNADPNKVTHLNMKVLYTSSWYDYKAEKEAAETLINRYKCELISQHADSMGAPLACKQYNIPNVCYNISTKDKTPETYLVASKINWEPYFEKIISVTKNRYEKTDLTTDIPLDWVGSLTKEETGESGVELLDYGKNVSEKAKTAVEKLRDTELKVFYTNTFTVSSSKNPFRVFGNELGQEIDKKIVNIVVDENNHITNCRADYLDLGDYVTDEGDVIQTGEGGSYFAESEYRQVTNDPFVSNFRSAPYFDLIIDGIDPLN